MSVEYRLGKIGVTVAQDLASKVFERSQRYVPTRTGRLKRSGKVRQVGSRGWEVVYLEGYAAAVEFGKQPGTERVRRHVVRSHSAHWGRRVVRIKRHWVRTHQRTVTGYPGRYFLLRAYNESLNQDLKQITKKATERQSYP